MVTNMCRNERRKADEKSSAVKAVLISPETWKMYFIPQIRDPFLIVYSRITICPSEYLYRSHKNYEIHGFLVK